MDNSTNVNMELLESIKSDEPTQDTQPQAGTEEVMSAVVEPTQNTETAEEPVAEAVQETAEAKVEEPTTEETAPEEQKAETPEAVTENSVVEDWDSTESKTDVDTDNTQTFFRDTSAALGFDVNNIDDIVNHVNQIKETSDPSKVFASDDLKNANEIAKSGGDWQSYLSISNVNYDDYSDQDLLKYDILNSMKGSSGMEDFNVDEYIESKFDDAEIRIKGNSIRQSLKNEQSKNVEKIQAQAQERKQFIDKGIKSALSSVTDIDGFKLDETHKTEIFNGLASGEMVNDMFHTDGKPDFDKMVENSFKIKYHDKIVSYLKTKTANATKRDVLKSINDVTTDSPNVGNELPEENNTTPIEFMVQHFQGK